MHSKPPLSSMSQAGEHQKQPKKVRSRLRESKPVCQIPNITAADLLHSIQELCSDIWSVTHHIHLCFHARMSDESQLAPQPRLYSINE